MGRAASHSRSFVVGRWPLTGVLLGILFCYVADKYMKYVRDKEWVVKKPRTLLVEPRGHKHHAFLSCLRCGHAAEAQAKTMDTPLKVFKAKEDLSRDSEPCGKEWELPAHTVINVLERVEERVEDAIEEYLMFHRTCNGRDDFYYVENCSKRLRPADARLRSVIIKAACVKALMFMYFPLTLAALSNLMCTPEIQAHKYLVADKGVQCWTWESSEGTHESHYFIAIISMLIMTLVGAGLPLGIALKVRHNLNVATKALINDGPTESKQTKHKQTGRGRSETRRLTFTKTKTNITGTNVVLKKMNRWYETPVLKYWPFCKKKVYMRAVVASRVSAFQEAPKIDAEPRSAQEHFRGQAIDGWSQRTTIQDPIYFLYQIFKPKYSWWMSFTLVRRVVLVWLFQWGQLHPCVNGAIRISSEESGELCSDASLNGTINWLSLAMVALVSDLVFQQWAKPYIEEDMNFVEALCTAGQLVVAAMSSGVKKPTARSIITRHIMFSHS